MNDNSKRDEKLPPRQKTRLRILAVLHLLQELRRHPMTVDAMASIYGVTRNRFFNIMSALHQTTGLSIEPVGLEKGRLRTLRYKVLSFGAFAKRKAQIPQTVSRDADGRFYIPRVYVNKTGESPRIIEPQLYTWRVLTLLRLLLTKPTPRKMLLKRIGMSRSNLNEFIYVLEQTCDVHITQSNEVFPNIGNPILYIKKGDAGVFDPEWLRGEHAKRVLNVLKPAPLLKGKKKA